MHCAEFVGLRAEMYSLHVASALKKSFIKVKGVQKHYVQTNVNHHNFLNILRNVNGNTVCKFRVFRSTNHAVNTVEISKLCSALSKTNAMLGMTAYTRWHMAIIY